MNYNIAHYIDYEVIEMETDMLTVLEEVESNDSGPVTTVLKFEQEHIKQAQLEEMNGRIEQTTTNVEENVTVQEVQTFKEFHNWIETIAPVSNDKAWISDCNNNVKLISQQMEDTQSKTLSSFNDFTVLTNGDFIVINFDD